MAGYDELSTPTNRNDVWFWSGLGTPQPLAWLAPRNLSLTLPARQSAEDILAIVNNGDADLSWVLTENPATGWLSEDPANGTVHPQPNNRQDVTLTFNTTGLSPGTYHTNLVVSSNDPDRPVRNVSVELTVKRTDVAIPPVSSDSSVVGTADPTHVTMPLLHVTLGDASPNPSVSHTSIPFALPHDCAVNLRVFTPSGVSVRTLASGFRSAGSYNTAWNGLDEHGREMRAGVYFVRLDADGATRVKKVVLQR